MDGTGSSLRELLDDSFATRVVAVERADATPAARYALRAVLRGDRDARARAAAGRRLGWIAHPEASPWLAEAALADAHAEVREAALLALCRAGDLEARVATERAAREDPVWWVRRAAVLACAAVAGERGIESLGDALADPFWRVRNAAIQALCALGDAAPARRAALLELTARGASDAVALGAHAYLAARWALPAPAAPLAPSTPAQRPDAPFWDPDPAVMAARLAAAHAPAPALPALLELLGDAHTTLRDAARAHLARSDDPAALAGALAWLRDPRVPYGPAAARDLLDAAPAARVAPVARAALTPDSPYGVMCWALAWAAREGREELAPAVLACTRAADPRARCAALAAYGALDPGAPAVLAGALSDPDERVRAVAAQWLCAHAPRAVPPLDAGAYRSLPPSARRALCAHAARSARGEGDERDPLEALLVAACDDPDPSARALALGARDARDALDAATRAAALASADPWVRAAVLRADDAAGVLARDPDPSVRRAVIARAAAHRDVLAPEACIAVARAAARDADPWIRARAPALLAAAERHAPDASALGPTLTLTRDPAHAVRAAAADALAHRPGLARDLGALLAAPPGVHPDALRAAAWALLPRVLSHAELAARLAAAEGDPGAGPDERAVRDALGITPGDEPLETAAMRTEITPGDDARRLEAPSERAVARGEAPADLAPRRALGRRGVMVAPVGISGANEPPLAALAAAREAGADTFFWEPHHRALTRFLRDDRRGRDERVVLAGSFHADAAGVTRDLHTALRRLRAERVDVFLLFWARSPARIDAAALATLERLRARGLVRAVGFSTHHRDMARRALAELDWDVVMTRHSAAHPGAERELLPTAVARGVGVVTFSALCYGRLLRPTAPDGFAPSAADCYRYSLAQPGVALCLTAPRSARELAHNLAALRAPALDPGALTALRAHGERVRARNVAFNALVRQARMVPPEPDARAALCALADHVAAERGPAREPLARRAEAAP